MSDQEQPFDSTLHVTDKRGQPKGNAAPESAEGAPQPDPDFQEAMAKQAAAAQEEDENQPVRATCFVVLMLDATGALHMLVRDEDLRKALANLVVDREATAADVMNMAGQMWISAQGREAASQMLQAMNVQMAQQVAARMPQNGLMPVDARIHQAAKGKR